MSIIQGTAHPAEGYNISRSLRCNSADSAYLTRTPSSTSNRRTWTWNGWFKKTSTADGQTLFSFGDNSTGATDVGAFVRFDSNAINFEEAHGGVSSFKLTTTQVFRDVSAWGMLTVAVDTTQATASNRIKLYWNGVQITTFSTTTYPAQNFDTSANVNGNPQRIGAIDVDGTVVGQYFNGYLTEVNFIDGQALTPSSFGETDAITGVWKPKKYTGTYGTNGFILTFEDNSGTTATTLGKDYSGNGNNWTPNNFSVTAGAGNDSLVDVPTRYGTDTGAGGEVRGNYCTLNPLDNNGITISDGNLRAVPTTADTCARATTAIPSTGKWYWEVLDLNQGQRGSAGLASVSRLISSFPTNLQDTILYTFWAGTIRDDGTDIATYSTLATNDIAMFAVDADSGKVWVGKNGTWFNSGAPASGTGNVTTLNSGVTYAPLAFEYGASPVTTTVWNFGQRPFAYTAPSGFKALCTTNLPTPSILKGSDNFNVVLDTGANIKTTAEAVFPSNYLEWIKDRANSNNHQLIDIVRGSSAVLQSNTAAVETTYSAPSGNSVGWVWKAGGTGVTNTAGTITSTVSANTTSGFSIVTYTGTGSNATVGHGLGVAPRMVIVKNRTGAANDWSVWHTGLTGGTYWIALNSTGAQLNDSTVFTSAPTSTVFNIGTGKPNQNTLTYVAYCFAPVAGFSAFGSYTGNGSADGPFVFTNMRPKWILLKRTDSTSGWLVIDTVRQTYNVLGPYLLANTSDAETTGTTVFDALSNGFKMRSATTLNDNGATYVYAAFAEFPFKTALAR